MAFGGTGIIILQHINQPSDYDYIVAFWVPVPVSRQFYYANPTFQTQVKQVNGAAPTSGQIAALQSGAIAEYIQEVAMPAGTPLATLESTVIAIYNTLATNLNNYNAVDYYGTTWDANTQTWAGQVQT